MKKARDFSLDVLFEGVADLAAPFVLAAAFIGGTWHWLRKLGGRKSTKH